MLAHDVKHPRYGELDHFVGSVLLHQSTQDERLELIDVPDAIIELGENVRRISQGFADREAREVAEVGERFVFWYRG